MPCPHESSRAARKEVEIVTRMKHLTCPCGTYLEGKDDDELVENTKEHLRNDHPGLEYTRDQILFLAY